jgi:hypothetical protein
MATLTALCLAVALLAAGWHAADAATAATETPLVLQAEHQDVNATLTTGGAKVTTPRQGLACNRLTGGHEQQHASPRDQNEHRTNQSTVPGKRPLKYSLTEPCAQAFVYNPEQLVGAARTTAVKSFGSAGTSSSRMAKQFPALSGYGIAQVRGAEAPPCVASP